MREIYIDISKDSGNSITTIQGNNNNKVYKLIVTDNNKRLDLTGKSVKMAYVNNKGDGDIIEGLQITNVVQGEISLPITNILTKQDGNYGCQLAIYNSSGFLEHTGSFSLIVKENLFNKISSGLLKTTTYQKLISILEKSEEMANNLHDAREVNSTLSNNINSGTNLDTKLGSNIKEGNLLNAALTQNKQDAANKNTELNKSLDETKKYIDGLDGSQNIPQIRMDITELQNGLKANQSLEYQGYNVTCNNTLEGRTEGMELRGRTLQNIIPKGFNSWKLIHQSFSIENNKINMIGTNGYHSLVYKDFTFKANTIYTLIVNVLRLDDIRQSDWCILRVGKGDGKANVTVTNPTTTGLYVTQFTTLGNTPVDVQTFLRKEAEGKRVVLSDLIILEGDWTNKEVPQYFEGIKSVGEEEINLCEFTELYGINSTTGADYADDTYCRSSYIPVEPNKTYSISPLKGYIGNAIYGYGKNKNFLGKGVTLQDKYTVGKDTYWIRLENRKSDTSQITQEDLSKIKRVVNKGDILYSYQEPLKSKISILSTGKNMIDIKTMSNIQLIDTYTGTTNMIIENGIRIYRYTALHYPQVTFKYLKKGTYISNWKQSYSDGIDRNVKLYIYPYEKTGTAIFWGNRQERIEIKESGLYQVGVITSANTLPRGVYVDITEFQFEENMVSTTFEQYQSDKKEILLNQPLRGLSTGSSDKIYEKDGKVVLEQNIDKDIFNGDENWKKYTVIQADGYFTAILEKQNAVQTYIVSNNFMYNERTWAGDFYNEGIQMSHTNSEPHLFIKISNSKLETQDIEGFKKWLQQNPTTVYYQLATPKITELNIKDLDLSVFQDVTHIISTNSIPAILGFKIPSNYGSVLQQQSKNINDLYRLIDEILVPQITNNTLDIELLKNK